ncbi:MAG: hypothetical protein Q7S06_02385 [Nanoarchaeota archaeon]|nr:hypothetical protein [Nanoarchaeota archaeon]
MNKEGISFLNQLIRSLEETEIKLEDAYNSKDSERLTRYKSFMLEIQKKIGEAL